MTAAKWHGAKWIRPAKRARIYKRDRYECVWCRAFVRPWGPPRPEDSIACLDHVLPRSRGGSNHHENLVTACVACNKRRGAKDALAFAGTFKDTAAVLARLIRAIGTELPA